MNDVLKTLAIPEFKKNEIKQKLFCEEYVVDRNGRQAAIRAGYAKGSAEVQASRLLINDKVKQYINYLLAQRSKRTEIDSDYVLKTIVETIERCKQDIQPVVTKQNGELVETGEYQFDSRAVLKGCELLGRHLKMFTDRVEIGLTDDLAERVRRAKEVRSV